MPAAIVIVVDRLGSGYLGPYGNTWVDTPAINRFASQSLLWEHLIADSPSLSSTYQTYWSGMHGLAVQLAHGQPQATPCLPQQLADADIPTVLISDESEVLDHPAATGFAEAIRVPTQLAETTVESIEQTQIASLFAHALQWLEQLNKNSSFLAWIHMRAMQGPWDAPQMFRELFHDEEDPDLPTWTTPPQQQTESFDPDELLGATQAYAGQVNALDNCLDAFWQALDDLSISQETLCTMTSPRGFPLGQHGRIGACDHPLYGELLHVPCILRLPAQAQAAKRIQSLVQPSNLYATLLNWFQQPDLLADQRTTPQPLAPTNPQPSTTDPRTASCKRAVAVGPEQWALRTPAWFLHKSATNLPELFVKPDDRWEINDVANRCPDIVEQMVLQLDLCQHYYAGPAGDCWPPLPDLLARGWE